MKIKEIEIISKYKILCYSEKYYIFCKGNIIYVFYNNLKLKFKIALPFGWKYIFFSKIRLFRRLLRLEPRCGTFVNETDVIVSCHGGIFKIDLVKEKVVLEHNFRHGMNNPLSFCGMFQYNQCEELVLYGEYFSNHNKEEVSIYQRNSEGEWNVVYTFLPGKINHIHGIFPGKDNRDYIVVTGDSNQESAIWWFSKDFKNSRIIAGGDQCYRSCAAFPYESGIIYATDTPLEDNYIYYIEFDKDSDISESKYMEPRVHKKLYKISGPCIYGTKLNNDNYIFATSVEPDSRIKGKRYMITYKLGKGVADRWSRIIMGNPKEGFKEVFKAKKDLFPMLLFQFGTFTFPSGDGELIATCQSLKRLDGKTIRIKI